MSAVCRSYTVSELNDILYYANGLKKAIWRKDKDKVRHFSDMLNGCCDRNE